MKRKQTKRHQESAVVRETTRLQRWLLYAFLLTSAIAFVFPFYWLVTSAHKTQEQIFTIPPQWLPYVHRADLEGEPVEVRVVETFKLPTVWADDRGDGTAGIVKPHHTNATGLVEVKGSPEEPWAVVTRVRRDERGEVVDTEGSYAIPEDAVRRKVHLNWANYRTVIEKTRLVRSFVNSSVIAAAHVALTLFLCSLAGTAFARYRRAPGHGWLFAFVVGTMLIPGAVTTIPVFVVLSRLSLINSYWAIIVPGAASAFGIFWLRQYVASNVPDDLYDAARIDGCSEFSVYWRVVLPIITPALGALGVLVLIGNWNNLLWAIIVLRTEHMRTMPLLVYLLNGEYETPFGLIMAAGTIAVLPLIIMFLLFQRWFIAGVASGAVKG